MTAANTLNEVARGTLERANALEKANAGVQQAENTLSQQLKSVPDDRKADYAKDFRETNPAYAAADKAASELRQYQVNNAPRVAEASQAVRNHPVPAIRDAGAGGVERGNAAATQALNGHAAAKANLTGVPQALGGAGFAAGQVGGAVRQAGGVLSGAGAALNAAENGQRLANGTGRTEHAVGLAANAAQIGLGVAVAAGATVSAPVSIGVAAVAIGSSAVGMARDSIANERDLSARLNRLGIERKSEPPLENLGMPL